MIRFIGLLLFAIPLAYYALYAIAVKSFSAKRSLKSSVKTSFAPFVSIVIPTYNEIKVIERRVKNLDVLDYPADKFEAIFVDGASMDGTPETIERLKAEGRSFIRLVRQPTRRGYNADMYEGISQAKADIVVMGESGTFFHPRAISNVVRHLNDPSIGVATGKAELYNPDESLATRLEAAYRKSHDQIRYAESLIDSTPDMKGELLALRKDIGLKLEPTVMLANNAAFDMSISFLTRSLGLRAIFDPEAVFYEHYATSMRDRLIVQTRRGSAWVGAVWNFRSMMFKRKFGYFGMLIAPSRALMLILFPWMLLAAPFVVLVESLYTPISGAIVLLIAAVALLVKRLRYTVLSFGLSQIVLAVATLRLLFRKHTQIINTVPTAR